MNIQTQNPSNQTKAVQLNWSESEDLTLVVTPENEDRFTIRMKKAIELLQRNNNDGEFQRQFDLLHKTLINWLKDHDVRGAFLTIRDGSLAFLVVRQSVEFDDDFEDALSELQFAVNTDSDLDEVPLQVVGLPCVDDAAVDSFLDRRFSIKYVHVSS